MQVESQSLSTYGAAGGANMGPITRAAYPNGMTPIQKITIALITVFMGASNHVKGRLRLNIRASSRIIQTIRMLAAPKITIPVQSKKDSMNASLLSDETSMTCGAHVNSDGDHNARK